MPELPEVETIRRHLTGALVGSRICSAESVAKLRKSCSSKELNAFCSQRSIQQVRRRAKYLLMLFNDGDAMIIHLGMTGYFVLAKGSDASCGAKHVCARWTLADGRILRYCDPRRFGQIILCPGAFFHRWPAQLQNLGLEPLSGSLDGDWLYAISRKRRCAIKTLIMDQQLLVGVGNIYASEALFRAGIAPQTAAQDLSKKDCARLASAIRQVLHEAIAAGGTTISDFRSLDGREGGFAVKLRVYGEAGKSCPRCGKLIERARIGGRSSFFCPACQPCRTPTP
jgi:formamidopyrimidine-DNA glycosylase